VTALYLIPVLGFVVYKVLGFVGFGVVLCTWFDSWRESRAARASAGSENAVPPAAPLAAPVATLTEPASVAAATAAPAVNATLAAAHAGMPRAGFWLRMAALFLDLMLVTVVTHIAYDMVRIRDPGSSVFLWTAVYGAIMWTLKGTTIGGSICGLQIVRTDGKPLDWGTSIMRALGCFLSLVVGGLGFIWIAVDKNQQAWHDKVAGTVVVRTPKGTPIV
jgi:uncharacterized RDD family membrane protein YckC